MRSCSRSADRSIPIRYRCLLPVSGLLLTLLVAGVAGDPNPAVAGSDPLGSPCRPAVETWLTPTWVSLGEPINVRSRLHFECPEREHAYHLALAIDLPAVGLGGPASNWVPGEIERLIDAMAWDENPRVMAGAVGYGDRAKTICAFTADAAVLKACLRRELAKPVAGAFEGPSALADGIRESAKALLLARGQDQPRRTDDPLEEGLLALALADTTPLCPPGRQCAERAEADAARENDIEVGVICLGGDCAASVLPELVASDHYYPVDFEAAAAHQARHAWSTELRVRAATVSEFLDGHMALQPDSMDPAGATYDPERHLVSWPSPLVGQGEARLAYTLMANEPGTWPVRRIGFVSFVDSQGDGGSIVLSDTSVTVTVVSRALFQIVLPWASRRGSGPHTYLESP